MADLIQVKPVALLPTQAGCAVFLSDGTKAIVFYIDPAIGASINAAIEGQPSSRPLTHDLYLLTLKAFGADVSRVVIVEMREEIYYARLILEAQNEIMERKIVELDCRPSDALAIAARSHTPVYVVRDLWERLDDMTDILSEMQKNQDNEGNSNPFP
jgi:bifunctional DNase/RNase